jgi:hypothetical protein
MHLLDYCSSPAKLNFPSAILKASLALKLPLAKSSKVLYYNSISSTDLSQFGKEKEGEKNGHVLHV